MNIAKLQTWKLAPFFKSKPESASMLAIHFPGITQSAGGFRNLQKLSLSCMKKNVHWNSLDTFTAISHLKLFNISALFQRARKADSGNFALDIFSICVAL